ncbi:MAG: AAA family ATPase, partial [Trichodesmium sp. MAG_R04]|nr:AAA family ATPase [Trichodesmium sp. MAG_R04]
MNNFFGLDLKEIIELAKELEEKAKTGEIKTSFDVQSGTMSNMSRMSNIPRRNRSPYQTQTGQSSQETNFTVQSPKTDDATEDKTQQKTSTNSSPENKSRPTLKDIGGMSEIIQELREVIELPLKRPDLLSKLGLEPSRGVLLVGPPGTGKTLTARAIAEELKLNYMAINGPEVMSKYYGEAEAKLREIFAKAKKSAPCLVFI